MDNSETSTTEDDLTEEERNVRVFAVQMLKHRQFIGQFQEIRRIDALQLFRDVIVINESEKELIKDIEVVRRRLRKFYGNDYWIGITGPEFIGAPSGHCLWVESENNPLGCYLYRIKGIRFRRNELIIRVKVIRPQIDNEQFENQNQSFEMAVTNFFQNFSWESTLKNVQHTVLEYIFWFFTIVCNVKNIKEAFTFLSVFIVTCIGLSAQTIVFLMNFSLKFMREASYFVQSTTPVMLAVVNLIGKIFGGFYLLIAMIWRDSWGGPPTLRREFYQPYRAIEMSTPRKFYNNRPRASIREID